MEWVLYLFGKKCDSYVKDLITQSCIAALLRFIKQRGIFSEIYTYIYLDNATSLHRS